MPSNISSDLEGMHLTCHARDMMVRRNISPNELTHCVAHGDPSEYKATKQGIQITVTEDTKVVYSTNTIGKIVVLTAVRTTKEFIWVNGKNAILMMKWGLLKSLQNNLSIHIKYEEGGFKVVGDQRSIDLGKYKLNCFEGTTVQVPS